MKYIVDSKEVSRDTFYFCQNAKEKNKTFVLLANDADVDGYINEHPDYDYYIRDDIETYYKKGEAIVKQWFSKNLGWYTCSLDGMKERYNKSKFKDTMTLEEWYTKNGWTLESETKYESKCYKMLIVADLEEKDVKTKLFSITVKNDYTVKAINEIRDKYGESCIEYVLRDYTFTEIIYKDHCKEI